MDENGSLPDSDVQCTITLQVKKTGAINIMSQDANPDTVEGTLLRALAFIQREILLARMGQSSATQRVISPRH